MLDQVDELIRAVLLRDLPVLTTSEQIRFQPPDDDLRTTVANLGLDVLSVYLVDVRENRNLRSPEWQLTHGPSGPLREPSPARVDCHYLISAWSPATLTPAIEPTLDEHVLLYQAMAALFRLDALNPSEVYPLGSLALNAVDELIRHQDLPIQVVPAEGWPRLGEFWSAMGTGQHWRPCLWLVVTVPVALRPQVAGPPVTTRILEFSQAGKPETAERWLQLGGTVTDSTGATVTGATVRLLGADGRLAGEATTGPDGHFSFGSLAADGYDVEATRPGTGSAVLATGVPNAGGAYELTLT